MRKYLIKFPPQTVALLPSPFVISVSASLFFFFFLFSFFLSFGVLASLFLIFDPTTEEELHTLLLCFPNKNSKKNKLLLLIMIKKEKSGRVLERWSF